MKNLYFTSDTHFGHKNIIRYSNRPFADVDEMNTTIINNINAKCPADAILYHFGDFGFGDEQFCSDILDRINCKVIFLDGNHDKPMRSQKVRSKFNPVTMFKSWVRSPVRDGLVQEMVPCVELKVKDPDAPRGEQLIVMCHYPMLQWNKAHHGSWMLHGHCHGSLKYPFPARILDVGVDPCGYWPISYNEVKQKMAKVKPESLDHHLIGD